MSSGRKSTLINDREEKNYQIYTATFHGHYLEPIQKQFIIKGRLGTRRRVIIIDFDKERQLRNDPKFKAISEETDMSTKAHHRQKLNFSIKTNMDIDLAISVIFRDRKTNADVTNKMVNDRQFNLIDYWMETMRNFTRNRQSNLPRKSLEKESTKKGARLLPIKEGVRDPTTIPCAKLKPQRHNRLGQMKFSYDEFIEDEPERSKIFIILVGNFEIDFLVGLLSRGEPLRGVFNFYPDESSYEKLVPNPERQNFVQRLLEKMDEKLVDLRQEYLTKPMGIFQHFIPVSSACHAENFSSKIYDQITWAFYDIQTIYDYYERYYVAPFREINVALPAKINLCDTYNDLARSSLKGNYIVSQFPGRVADKATITLYLDMLFNQIANSDGILTEWEMVLLSTTLPKRLFAVYKNSVEELSARFRDAFISITKIKKFERVFIEANNEMLTNIIQYVNQEYFRQIFLACLEYKQLRKYMTNHPGSDIPAQRKSPSDDAQLPMYAKFYMTNDSVEQRLHVLHNEYDTDVVIDLSPQYTLHHFRRNLNEIIEHNRLYVLPTRLCFRDFTLFKMEEFLRSLITPEIIESRTVSNLSEMERFEELIQRHAHDFNLDIFIRPMSLKANRIQTVSTLLSVKTNRRVSHRDSVREREIQMAAEALMEYASNSSLMGLSPDHPLLRGFNLDDVRQEIWVKTSRYFFEEGNLELYEERWCFDDTNKNLVFKFKNNQLTLNTPQDDLLSVNSQMRLTTINDIEIRLYEDPTECSKIVINYPNGLSVNYHEFHVEQVWSRAGTPSDEKRRIITPFGAIIIEYMKDDLFIIMRYNGEVYRLYQQELPINEEKDFDSSTEPSSELRLRMSVHVQNMIASLRDVPPQPIDKSRDNSRLPKAARLSRRMPNSAPGQRKRTSGRSTATSMQSVMYESTISLGTSFDNEKDVITNEMDFLRKISRIYSLTYRHLIVTTSTGRIFNVLADGTCYETFKLKNDEWHDYVVNESYAMREDGVHMIWGDDYLKCYHIDKTVITTRADVVYHDFDLDDEKDDNTYSQSSSHVGFEDNGSGDHMVKLEEQTDPSHSRRSRKPSLTRRRRLKSYEPFLNPLGEIAEEGAGRKFDNGFMCMNVSSQGMHHANYVSVLFWPQLISYDTVYFVMEVKTLDDVILHRTRESILSRYTVNSTFDDDEETTSLTTQTDGTQYNMGGDPSFTSRTKMHLTSPRISTSPETLRPSREKKQGSENSEPGEDEIFEDVTKIWIGNDFFMRISETNVEIHVVLKHERRLVRTTKGKLVFRFSFSENLPKIFREIVERISTFKRYHEPKTEEIIFLERCNEECEFKGFEFYENLDDVKEEFSKIVGNATNRFTALKPIMEKFKQNYDWFNKDQLKFPRFSKGTQKTEDPSNDFPMVLTANIYLKIPDYFRNHRDIQKFMDPLDEVTFKSTRHQIQETVRPYMEPQITKEVRKLFSANSWKIHHSKMNRQRLIEAQRMGLYHAMLRHKRFPNYFIFSKDYDSKAQMINYFDFCLQQCAEKPKSVGIKKSLHGTQSTVSRRSFIPKGSAYSTRTAKTAVSMQSL